MHHDAGAGGLSGGEIGVSALDGAWKVSVCLSSLQGKEGEGKWAAFHGERACQGRDAELCLADHVDGG